MNKLQKTLIAIILSAPTASLFSQMETEGLISTSGTSLVGENIIIDYSMGAWTSLNMDNSNGQISNGIQQSDYFIITSLSEVKQKISINVYPNPTISNIHIDIADNLQYEMSAVLRNAEGKVVLTQSVKKSDSINLDHLPAQIYYLSISHPDINSVQQFKVIKVK